MTVKSRVGRVRHVAFRVHADAPPSRAAVVDAVRAAARRLLAPEAVEAMGAEVTAFDGRDGLLRVRHTHAADARRVLAEAGEAAPFRIEPLGTSGTMRAARRKWLRGEAAVRRRPRRGKARSPRGK